MFEKYQVSTWSICIISWLFNIVQTNESVPVDLKCRLKLDTLISLHVARLSLMIHGVVYNAQLIYMYTYKL